jgi:hypothetical protein
MQDTKFAWADDELPTRREERERERTRDDRETVDTPRPSAETLRQLEPPRAFTKIDDPSAPATAAASSAPAAPTTSPSPAAESLTPVTPVADKIAFQPDPLVGTPATAMPSNESLFATKPLFANDPASGSLDALFGQRDARQATPKPRTPIITADAVAPTTGTAPVPVGNGPAWIIAMVPLFQLVLSLLLMNFGLGGVPAIFIGILVVPYFIVLGLAYADYRALDAAGYDHPANWKFAFLTSPVYLLMRARAVIAASGHGMGPVLAWFGLAVLHVASVLAIPGLVISVVPNLFTPQIEQSVARDAQLISGTQIRVSCTSAPPVLIGQMTTCESTSPTGSKSQITVALSRSNGWIAWQVVDWGEVTMKR